MGIGSTVGLLRIHHEIVTLSIDGFMDFMMLTLGHTPALLMSSVTRDFIVVVIVQTDQTPMSRRRRWWLSEFLVICSLVFLRGV